jgi:hypothetical protein
MLEDKQRLVLFATFHIKNIIHNRKKHTEQAFEKLHKQRHKYQTAVYIVLQHKNPNICPAFINTASSQFFCRLQTCLLAEQQYTKTTEICMVTKITINMDQY